MQSEIIDKIKYFLSSTTGTGMLSNNLKAAATKQINQSTVNQVKEMIEDNKPQMIELIGRDGVHFFNTLNYSYMQKGTIIIGAPATGKTTKAREISKVFNKENIVQIFSDNTSYCKKNTELIIREEVLYTSSIDYWREVIVLGIPVKTPNEFTETIHPKIVLVSNKITKEDLAKLDFTIEDYFEVIECFYNPNHRPTVPSSEPKKS